MMKHNLKMIAIVLGMVAIALVLFTRNIKAQDTTKVKKVVKITTQSTKDTTIKGITHKLYVGAKGGRYIIVTSKTGNQYKKYFKSK